MYSAFSIAEASDIVCWYWLFLGNSTKHISHDITDSWLHTMLCTRKNHYWVGWYSGYTSHSYLAWCLVWMPVIQVFHCLSQSLQANWRRVLSLSHDCFHPYSFQFIFHYHLMLYSLATDLNGMVQVQHVTVMLMFWIPQLKFSMSIFMLWTFCKYNFVSLCITYFANIFGFRIAADENLSYHYGLHTTTCTCQ